MPSASTAPPLTCSTWSKWRTSSLRRAPDARSRKRFEVSFASEIAPPAAPTAAPALSCAASASFFCVWCFVEEVPAHRVAGAGDVALAEHDLEQVRAAVRRAEHLGAAVEVQAPDAAEALVEAARLERADLVPVAVEALGPG